MIFSCDYGLVPPVSSRGAGGRGGNNQKNTLIGDGDWCETSVFYVFDFQMSAGEEAVSLPQQFWGETGGVVAGVG